MNKMIAFEIRKLNKTKVFAKSIIYVVVWLLISALLIKFNPGMASTESVIQNSFLVYSLVNVLTIFYACSSFSEEFSNRTIITIISMGYKREKIFGAKLFTLLLFHISLAMLSLIFSLISSIIILKASLNILLLKNAVLFCLGNIISIWMILLLALLLILLTKKETTGLIVSLFVYVLYGLGTGINFLLISKLPLLKYNIVNVFNLQAQLIDSTYGSLTLLTTPHMLLINIMYILFLLLFSIHVSRNIEV